MGLGFPLINSDYYSFSDVEFRFNGLFFVGIKSINYSDTLERNNVYGSARKPLGQSSGHYSAKGDVEFYKPAFDLLVTTISALGLAFGGWRQISFTVTVSYGTPGLSLPVTTDLITGVRLTDCEASQSEGSDALTRKLTMFPQEIQWNGVPSVVEPLVLSAVA